MTNGWPEEYYAVIFTTQRSDAEMELYGLTSQRMIELAQKQPGFLGLEAVREVLQNTLPANLLIGQQPHTFENKHWWCFLLRAGTIALAMG